MKTLMFGWEFPPHISGGLGTACYGLTKALSANPEIDLTFVVPKTWGDEPADRTKLIGANQIDLIKSKIRIERLETQHTCFSVQSQMVPYIDPEMYKRLPEFERQVCSHGIIDNPTQEESLQPVKFTGEYNSDLMTEIHNFSVVAEHIAGQRKFDIIHAHDWLTFPAGMLAKKITGKPLVVHVHATDFDRSGGKANPDVFKIEKKGMEAADRIIAVSNHTSQIISEKYSIDPNKIITVHNGVEPFITNGVKNGLKRKRKVTFLGRITMQKGPQYFVEIARKVLDRIDDVEFVMAGSGDMMKPMINLVNEYKISDKFHFPGFLKGDEVAQMYNLSDVYIMPSVSEPFGISPLEAMYCGVPVIISKQSGVSEVIQHAIKADFWDTNAMADAVYSILTRPALNRMLTNKGADEVRKISWEKSASKITRIYKELTRA